MILSIPCRKCECRRGERAKVVYGGRALSVPQSVSQSAWVIIIIISANCISKTKMWLPWVCTTKAAATRQDSELSWNMIPLKKSKKWRKVEKIKILNKACFVWSKHRRYLSWYQLFGVKLDIMVQIVTEYQRF